MKQVLQICCGGLLVCLLTACSLEKPYRVDTVVWIPVDPAAASEIPETAAPETTEEVTETVVTEETQKKTPAAIWLGVIVACAGAIVVLLVNRKRIFRTDL